MEYNYAESPAGKRRFENTEIYKKTFELQEFLFNLSYAWHNPFSNECTQDFACCVGDKDYKAYFPSYKASLKHHLDELFLQCEHGDEEHRKWLKDKFNSYLETVNDDD